MKSSLITQEINEFGGAVRRYGRIILALLRREEESRRQAPMESILNLLEPVFLVTLIVLARWSLERLHGAPLGGSVALFYATGFFAKYYFIYLSRRMRRSVDSPARRFPLEQRLDHILVHIILSTADYLVLGLIGFGFIYVFFTPQALPYNVVPVIEACIAIIMLGFGWGVLNLVMTKALWFWRYFFPPFNRALVLFSGVFFIVDFMSPGVRYMLSFNPMVHAIALFRTGFYPNHPTLVLDTRYLAFCAIGAVVFGLVLERATRRREG